jgi:DtxR family Mn-dependent transcriptional regulator
VNSFTEENYLKAIFSIMQETDKGASTTAISERLHTKASSVTDMVKKLAEKKLVNYKKYQGVTLTEAGRKIALSIIRKHRLWEVFLVEKLSFKWDEVHDIAEQLEHIRSPKLTEKLDAFLEHPKFDPHGDPIPDKDGNIITHKETYTLQELELNESGVIVGVNDSSTEFLQYLENQMLMLGTKLKVVSIFDYDKSMQITAGGKKELTLSQQVCNNLLIRKMV